MANVLYEELAPVAGVVKPRIGGRNAIKAAAVLVSARAALARADRVVAAYLAELAAARSRGSRYARA